MKNEENKEIVKTLVNYSRHPKCKVILMPDYGWGNDIDCGYQTKLTCDECKYGGGNKNPEAKINKL